MGIRIFFVCLIFLNLSLTKANCQNAESMLNQLMAIDEEKYIGKPLDSMINVLPPGYIEMKIVAGAHRYTARKLRIRYNNEVWIELHVRQFQFMNPASTTRTWDINLMRNEKLYHLVIYKDTQCYLNCKIH